MWHVIHNLPKLGGRGFNRFHSPAFLAPTPPYPLKILQYIVGTSSNTNYNYGFDLLLLCMFSISCQSVLSIPVLYFCCEMPHLLFFFSQIILSVNCCQTILTHLQYTIGSNKLFIIYYTIFPSNNCWNDLLPTGHVSNTIIMSVCLWEECCGGRHFGSVAHQ